MPESGNVHTAIAVIDAVDDTVGTNDNLAQRGIAEFGHDSAHLREISEALGIADEELAENDGALG